MCSKGDAASSNSTEWAWLSDSGTSPGTASERDSWKLWCDTSSRGHTHSEAALVDCLSDVEDSNRTRIDWNHISAHWDRHGWYRGSHRTSQGRDFKRMDSGVKASHGCWCNDRRNTADARNIGCSHRGWRWCWCGSNWTVWSRADNWDGRTGACTACCRG